jgi:ketosteroid isomerase-like protein
MTRQDIATWVDRYERAWRTAGTDAARALFTADATYQAAPYDEPIRGADAIAAFWDQERDGPDEPFTMTSELVAVEGGTGVVRVEVHYSGAAPREYRDLWIVRLTGDGRCSAFEEWPFWPERPRTALTGR